MMARVASFVGDDVSPLLKRPEDVKKAVVIVVAGDKGLCGAYNANLNRRAWQYIKERARGRRRRSTSSASVVALPAR